MAPKDDLGAWAAAFDDWNQRSDCSKSQLAHALLSRNTDVEDRQ